MDVRRGDFVAVALAGDYGKPRPALIVQDDAFDALPSVTVLPLTSELRDAPLLRITIDPEAQNGLQRRSQIMVDKAAPVTRGRIGTCIGRLDPAAMQVVDSALRRFLGLG